jgi:hypothetical protein
MGTKTAVQTADLPDKNERATMNEEREVKPDAEYSADWTA